MKKERFYQLLSKKLANTLTEGETKELSLAVAEDHSYKQIYKAMVFYSEDTLSNTLNKKPLDQIWERAEHTPTTPLDFSVRPKYTFTWLRVAAICCLAISIVLVAYQFYQTTIGGFLSFSTSKEKAMVLLDDGTKIWLNKQSELRYNKDFGESKREVFLKGEAYFDVVKNRKVPLVVHVGDIDIKVKGTSFNVAAQKERKDIQIALISGLIEVTHRRINKTVSVKPFQKLIFNRDGNANPFSVVLIPAADMLHQVEWKNDTLRFDKEKLKDLALKLEKKFQVTITIASAKLKEKRFSGTFVNETIEQALEALKLSYPLTYTINNNQIVVKD